jgi:hypothetical protein
MALYDVLLGLFTDNEQQEEFNNDPEGYLDSHNVGDVTAVDVQQEMQRVLANTQGNQSTANQGGFADFSGSGVVNIPPPPHYAAYAESPDHGGLAGALETIDYYQSVTNVTNQEYNDNDTSTVYDNDTNIDNSINQDITSFGGDINQDFDSNVATGDGAVAGVENSQVQTGDGIQVGGDVDDSNLVSGDVSNSTLADDISDSAVVSGSTVGGSVVGDDVNDSILGNDNQAIVDSEVGAAGFGSGDVSNTEINADNANVGDGNVLVDGDIEGNANLGDGSQVNIDDSIVEDAAFGGGDVTDITADDGAAVALGGDAEGSNTDVDVDGDVYGNVQAAGNDATQVVDQSYEETNTDSFNDTTNQDLTIDDSIADVDQAGDTADDVLDV